MLGVKLLRDFLNFNKIKDIIETLDYIFSGDKGNSSTDI